MRLLASRPTVNLRTAKDKKAETPSTNLSRPVLSRALQAWPYFVVMAATLLVVLPFARLGIPSGHDFEFHLDSWMEVLGQWKQGIFYPRWASLAHYGYGEARFLFYPPSSWMLGASIGAVLPWKLAPAAYIWVVLTLSGCSMLLLAKRFLTLPHAIFAAVLYAVNPYHIVIVYWRSAFAELLAGALLPLLLLFVLRPLGRATIALGLVAAGAWLTNAPSAVMVNYSLVLLAIVVSIVTRSARPLASAAIAAALGLALSAFYVLPAAYEQKWVNIEQVLSPGLQPQDNFLFTTIADKEHNAFNHLVSVVAACELAALPVVLLFGYRRRSQQRELFWPVAVWATASSLLMISMSAFFWRHLPQLRFIQLPWRWLLCLNAALALLATLASRRWWPRALVCLAMVASLVYAWHRIQAPWWDTAAGITEMQTTFQDSHGYEGTDEYVPDATDAYDINQNARKATFDGQGRAHIVVHKWGAESKHITASVTSPGKLVLRLFNFPAWQVTVNDRRVQTETRSHTGEVLIPVDTGLNEVRVNFVRTWDRILGGIISLLTILLVVTAAFWRWPQSSLLHRLTLRQ